MRFRVLARIRMPADSVVLDVVLSQLPWKEEDLLGIDHPDKTSNKGRFGFEKAIKILG